MANADTPIGKRDFSSTDAKRGFMMLTLLVISGAIYWFALPAIQSLVIPQLPGGANGPWVVRPILAFHAGAAAVLACLTIPLVAYPLRNLWEHEDREMATRYDPFRGRPIRRVLFIVKAAILFLLYASALVFYLFSWTIIGPKGIEQRLPWGKSNYSFQDIDSLETIPDGQRSESLRQNGPWYSIRFEKGPSITLSLNNEGTTAAELEAMTSFLANRAGKVWKPRADAQRR